MDVTFPNRLIDALCKHRVDFVVIGGLAVNYHGYVRATEDTDIVFLRTEENEVRLAAVLSSINASWISNEIDLATGIEQTFPVTLEFVRASSLMMLVTEFGFLDIFDFIPGLAQASVQELYDTADEYDGVRFSSLRWLRAMKQASNRSKDQEDLASLPQDR